MNENQNRGLPLQKGVVADLWGKDLRCLQTEVWLLGSVVRHLPD